MWKLVVNHATCLFLGHALSFWLKPDPECVVIESTTRVVPSMLLFSPCRMALSPSVFAAARVRKSNWTPDQFARLFGRRVCAGAASTQKSIYLVVWRVPAAGLFALDLIAHPHTQPLALILLSGWMRAARTVQRCDTNAHQSLLTLRLLMILGPC